MSKFVKQKLGLKL